MRHDQQCGDPGEFRLHHLISVTHGKRAIRPKSHSCARMVRHTDDALLPPFRIGANKISIPGEEHNVCAGNILFCPLSSLSKLMDTCCFSMCVQTEKKRQHVLDPSYSHTKATNDIINNCEESWIEMVGPSFLHNNRHAMDEKNDVYLQHNDKRKAQLWRQ